MSFQSYKKWAVNSKSENINEVGKRCPQRGRIAEIAEKTLRRMIFLKNLPSISSDFHTKLLLTPPTALEIFRVYI